MTRMTVKLSTLRLSPLNVRKVEPKAIEAMAADISAHGLIQNLVTYKEKRNQMVCAGGRRFRALKLLQKQKKIDGSYEVAIDERTKTEAVELSLAENVQREDMHPADCVAGYRELVNDGLTVADIAGRFGVSEAYVRRVLKLAALHPDILAAFAADEIGMDAAQAYCLTDDIEQQLEVFRENGDHAHRVRSILTDEKIATKSKLFNFVSLEDYKNAGGTITADLFAKEGEGYANDPQILFKLVEGKLSKVEQGYIDDGWSQVVLCESRPDNFYSLNLMQPEGRKEPNKKQAKALAENEAAQQAILDDEDADPHFNSELRALEREARQIKEALAYHTDEQKEHGRAIIFLDYDGELAVHAVDLRKPKQANVTKLPKPDYSAKLVSELVKVKTLAVREAVATNPELALDVLLHTLLQNIAFDGCAYDLPLSIKPESRGVEVDEDLMVQSDIRSVEDIAAKDMGALSDEISLPDIVTMGRKTKQKLLGFLIASQIDTRGCYNSDGVSHMDDIASVAQIDLKTKWQPSVAFFERISKPTLLKILRDQCGNAAADNCASMKKSDLALAMAGRLAGKDWLPPALCIKPETEEMKEAA